MSEQSRKEDYTPYLIELMKSSEMGDFKKVKTLLIRRKYTIEAVDVSIRKCIFKYFRTKPEYIKTIAELMRHSDLNFQNPTFDNTNPIMLASAKGDPFLIKEIIEQTDLPKKIEIDLTKKDKNDMNFIHYILTRNTNEEEAIEILIYLLKYYAKIKNKKVKIEDLLTQKAKDGHCPITLILLKGWHKMLNVYFSYVNYQSYVLPDSSNNLVHLAIEGKSLLCLKKIVSYSSIDDLKMKNKDSNTPALLANKKKYYLFSKILEQIELNFNNNTFRRYLLGDELSVNDMIDFYNKKDYNKALNMLSAYKVNQTIIGDITNIPFEWNIMLTKRNVSLQKGTNNDTKKQTIMSINDLSKFFNRYMKDMNIIDHIDEESFPIDIVLYNKVIFYMKIGDMTTAINTISIYLNHINQQSSIKYYKFIIFVNLFFVLIENFIRNNQMPIAMSLIDKVEDYLLTKFKQRDSNENQIVINYLNNNEIINQFSPTWDESFCYLNLLKGLCNYDNTPKKWLSEYKKNAKSCDYSKDLKIFNRLKAMYIMIKAKLNYKNNFILKSFKKISLIKDNFFDLSIEHKLFYFNSIGILNLRLKNYSYAEFMFKSGIRLCQQISVNANGDNLLIQRMNYIIYMKYNLALSLFYQKKYYQSNQLLKELSEKKIMNNNVYLWYRLGMTCLEIHLISSKVNSQSIKTIGFKQNNSISNNDTEEDNNEANKDFDYLYHQFEKEYGDYYSDNNSNNTLTYTSSKLSHRIILPHDKQRVTNDNLNEAISSFKKVISLQCDVKDNSEIIKTLSRMMSAPPDVEKTSKVNPNLLWSTYLNLLFCFSLTGQWMEILFLSKTLLSRPNIANELKEKISLFKIEALIHLQKYEEAMNCVNTSIARQENIRIDLYQSNHCNLMKDIPLKIGLRIQMIYVNCKMNNYEEAERNLIELKDTFYKGRENEIPLYLIYIGIYIYLLEGNITKALKIIKTRTL